MSFKKRYAGKLARDSGQSFEYFFERRCEAESIIFIKIPDGCKRIKQGARLRLIPVATPFDCVITKDSNAVCLDLKTIQTTNFTYSQIKPHQREALSNVGRSLTAGYLIWFRKIDEVVFFDHKQIAECKSGGSLKPKEGLLLGTLQDMRVDILMGLQ